VGPNGAGKTTSLKILATLLRPQTGTARILGMEVGSEFVDVRRRIGFMPDSFSMYKQMTVFEFLDFFAAAYGIGSSQRERIVTDVLALTDMDGRRNDSIKALSRGMQQRVSLARVLVNDPDVLLLDEPASGLDPRARIELMEILRELRGMGKTIFISSHILSELGELCDSFTIIDKGKTRYTGPLSGLSLERDQGGRSRYRVLLAREEPVVVEALRLTSGVIEVRTPDESTCVHVTVDSELLSGNGVLGVVLREGGDVLAFNPEVVGLSDAFMSLTDPGVRSDG
jgi:ABC-2 type transport system ATP-binding protein